MLAVGIQTLPAARFLLGYSHWLPLVLKFKLEKVAVANALQLEAARATPALSRFNYNAMPTLTSLNLSIAVL